VPPVVSAALFFLCWQWAQGAVHFCARAPKRRWYQQRVGAVSPREGDLLFRRRFLGAGRGSLALERGSLELREGSFELRGGSLKMVRRRACSVLSAATWRERLSISCRSVMLGGGPTLASAGWDAISEMRSAQRAAASKLHSC
jgi:hypothetical protein